MLKYLLENDERGIVISEGETIVKYFLLYTVDIVAGSTSFDELQKDLLGVDIPVINDPWVNAGSGAYEECDDFLTLSD